MKIGYARDSKKNQNLDLQLDALKAAGCEKIYAEKGVTRAKRNAKGEATVRNERDAAVDALRAGDTFVVWKLDRLGGSLKQLLAFLEDLDERGVAFVSLTESIDTSTPTGRLFRDFILVLANFERERLIERTNAGLAAARARGRRGGRRPSLTADQVRLAKAILSDDTMSASDVCKQLGVSRSTLHAYIGPIGQYRAVRKTAEAGSHEISP